MDDHETSQQVSLAGKRPRPIVSCLLCRKKKLRCDRCLPCSKCVKSGRADICEYESGQEPLQHTVETAPHDTKRLRVHEASLDSSSTVSVEQLDDLQARVQQLEQRLQLHRDGSRLQPPVHVYISEETTYPTVVSVVSETSQLSQSQDVLRRPLLEQFPSLRDFVEHLGRDDIPESMHAVATKIRLLSTKISLQTRPRGYFRIYHNVQDVTEQMAHLLPPSHICKLLIEDYFHYFENCTRVLHRSTALTLFRAFLNSTCIDEKRVSCIATLLAVVSIASSLGVHPESHNPQLHGQDDGFGAYHLLRNYLDLVSSKTWLELSTIQIAVLTLKFHKSSPLNNYERWLWSGQIVRRAMAANIHVSSEDIFESEMRRRLWLTILELDFTFAIESDMPANGPHWTGTRPVNVDDRELYPGMLAIPSSKNTESWTDGICQYTLSQSLEDRRLAYSTVWMRPTVSYDTVRQHTRHLEQIIHDLPLPFRLGRATDEGSDTPERLMAQMELDFLLRRPLNATYAYYAAQMPADDRYKEARIPWIQSCTVSICFQDLFDPKYPMLDLPEPRGLWDYFYNVYDWDAQRYMLANCLELQRLRCANKEAPDIPSPAFEGHALRTSVKVMGWNIEGIIHSLEDTINPMTRRVGRYGSSLADVVRWTAIIGSLCVSTCAPKLHTIEDDLHALVLTLQNQLGLNADLRHPVAATSFGDDALSNSMWLRDLLLHADMEDDATAK